ncbi:54S ribosomal protein L2 mitochondrial [Malassezia sp. CBS 17886]|nr:54S ribosomal protein L2 mitochondrial [Malassezia sp. CBS 17886]
MRSAVVPGAFAGAVRTASLRIATPVQTGLLMSSLLARASLSERGPLPPFSFGAAVQTRNSAKRGGGTTKNNRNSAGRRLGIKRLGANFAQPGDIIVRQRGTSWHPGENVSMGRDHTLYATVPGFVKFYKPPPLPERGAQRLAPLGGLPLRRLQPTEIQPPCPEAVRPHPSSSRPERRYVGVVLSRDAVLPAPRGKPRARLFAKVDLNAIEREKELRRQGVEPIALDAALAS